MAYYAALISLVQLVKEISHPDDYRYPYYPHDRQQITSLCEKLSHLQELLEDYSPKDHEEEADSLERRIRDLAYQAQDFIESHFSDQIPSNRNFMIQGGKSYSVQRFRQQVDKVKVQRLLQQVEKVKVEVDSIREELLRIKESYKARENDLQLKNSNISADGELLPLLQLLEEISHHDRYPKSFLDKAQLASLYEKVKLLQELQDKEKFADFIGRRIADATYRARDIIETHLSNKMLGDLTLSILAKEYHDLEKVKEEVGSIVEEMMRIKMESLTTHHNQDEQETTIKAQPCGESSKLEAVSIVGTGDTEISGGTPKVQAPSGRNIMVGFDEHLTKIKEQLCGQSSRLEVISIVGMGGIGKTTLARNIFDDKLVDDYFDCCSWVTVTQDYHLRNVLLAIVTSLSKNQESHGVGEEVLKEHIYKHLKGRRYLIIMDDMWDTKIWDAIKRILPDDSNGSRIILTSRLLDVATYAGSLGFLLHMQFLNEDQSWSLFCEKVVCPHELEDIGRLIAKNCRGLPLAIVVVAGLLSKANTTRYDWEEIARGVSSTAAENDEHFSKILSLSYNHLPHHLKPCFLYFGGFPEDYKIPISKLIKLWVAEGFLKQIEDKTFEEVAEEYLEDLVNRNLLLVTKWRSNGKFKCCSIHDLLRDLCSERARNENFLHFPRNNDDFHQDAIANVYRLYIHQDSSFPKFQVKDYVSYVRSILFFRDTWDRFSSDASDFKLLRVLDAPNVMFDFFPTQILKLLYLRYLALLTRKFRIPSLIVKLQNLQTLIISSVPSLSPSPVLLPFEIWKMPQLRHIMIDEARLPNIHHGSYTRGVPFLESLQTLWNVANCTFTHGTVEMIPNLKKLKVVYSKQKTWTKFGLNNLVHLQGLEILDIRFTLYGFHEYVEVPLPERFVFPLKLKKLSLKGCMLPWKDMTVVGLLPNLQVLKLRWASFVGEDWVPTEGQFLKLKYLLMEELYDLKYWEAENTHFPCLEQLQINNCKALEEIPSGIGDTPTLQLIEVFNSDSALESSAERILEEQRELGNDVLKVHIYRWDSNSSMGDESSEDDEALQETSSEH